MLRTNYLIIILFILLFCYACSKSRHNYVNEVSVKNNQIDSIINYALKEESNYINPYDSICGLIRLSKLNEIYQIEIVITDKRSLKFIDEQFYPLYYFVYKKFPVFIINKTIDPEFFQITTNKKYFPYPKIRTKENTYKNSNDNRLNTLNKKPPLPPINFEPVEYIFIYFDGKAYFQRNDTFMFEQFKLL